MQCLFLRFIRQMLNRDPPHILGRWNHKLDVHRYYEGGTYPY
jgi:hypothetical protein